MNENENTTPEVNIDGKPQPENVTQGEMDSGDSSIDSAVNKVATPTSPNTENMRLPLMVGGVAVVAIVGAAGFALLNPQNDYDPVGEHLSLSGDAEQQIMEALDYQEGTYVVEVSYEVPEAGFTDHMRVTVTIKDEKITSAVATKLEEGEEVENEYMDAFNDAIAGMIIGKRPDSIYGLELKSGSTLTADAFKDAVRTIEKQAEVVAAVNYYEDGEYVVETTYYVPVADKTDVIRTTVILEDGVIKSVAVVVLEDGVVSDSTYMTEFTDYMTTELVGMSLGDAKDSAFKSGSTLTSDSFIEALEQVETESAV